MPGHAIPVHRVTLLVGAVNVDVAPVGPIAILFGKLGVNAVIEVGVFVRTAFVQSPQIFN
jgi:hypothetical protein